MQILYKYVIIGEAELVGELTPLQIKELSECLVNVGLELVIENKNERIAQIKIACQCWMDSAELSKIKRSAYLAGIFDCTYDHLAFCFKAVEGITIEQYCIGYIVDRAKHLLINSNYSISQIIDMLNYKDDSHFYWQFKKYTTMTPQKFRDLYSNTGFEKIP